MQYRKTGFMAQIRFSMKSLQNFPIDRNKVEGGTQSAKKP